MAVIWTEEDLVEISKIEQDNIDEFNKWAALKDEITKALEKE